MTCENESKRCDIADVTTILRHRSALAPHTPATHSRVIRACFGEYAALAAEMFGVPFLAYNPYVGVPRG